MRSLLAIVGFAVFVASASSPSPACAGGLVGFIDASTVEAPGPGICSDGSATELASDVTEATAESAALLERLTEQRRIADDGPKTSGGLTPDFEQLFWDIVQNR